MTKFEKWFIKRVFAREVMQDWNHDKKITCLYQLIYDACKKEFYEDNAVTLNTFLVECFENVLHPENVPTLYANGYREWCLNGKRHREDGPAIEYGNGDRAWYLNGELHREDGPAVEGTNGYREWCLNGERHREDGPAIEDANGYRAWHLNGVNYSEEEFNIEMKKQKSSCAGKIIDIDGKKYKLTEL